MQSRKPKRQSVADALAGAAPRIAPTKRGARAPRDGAARIVALAVARRIMELREAAGMSRAALAAAVGMKVGAIRRVEAAKVQIGASRLFAVGEALQTPVGRFFDGLDLRDVYAPVAAASGARDMAEIRALLDAFYGAGDAPRRRELLRMMRSAAAGLATAMEPGR